MSGHCNVPPPVLFNCLKHHLGYIREYILTTALSKNMASMPHQLLLIGESQMDLYTGELTPGMIALQIIKLLQENGNYKKDQYLNYIRVQSTGYQTLQISDTSVWVLRLGEQEERYIHMHPGRYSLQTIRVKANTLKTAIALSIWMKVYDHRELTLALLNLVRKEILAASPVKSLSTTDGFGKIFRLVHSEF
jgi:hypothetical protein